MKYFVFRNHTIEPFFEHLDVEFSGYDDIASIPVADAYIWFYQIPIKFDTHILCEEVLLYRDKLEWVYQHIPSRKPLYIFSLVHLFPYSLEDSNHTLRDAITAFHVFVDTLPKDRIKVIDLAEFIQRYPIESVINWKYYFLTRTLLNPLLAIDFQSWWGMKLASIQQKRKKCLVLDLDNTLWGGVLGEEGAQGIKIGGIYPGNAFLAFQQALLELQKAGVILTICSKNNEKDVFDVWEQNPFLLLRKEHFATYRINWQNKADNIREISEELNIGLDSLVFIDDNPTERELVRQLLPEVVVPEFPAQPYLLLPFIKQITDQYLRIYTLTHEDRYKTEQYKSNSLRAQEQAKFSDLHDFICSLQLQLHVEEMNDFNQVRIAQMTQKTNQFNLTTKRYTENDLQQFVHQDARIYCLSVSDRFGDNGITGAMILTPLRFHTYMIDSLLLSCRILGKGIEKAFVQLILNQLWQAGATEIRATYIPTQKNQQTKLFYESCGFTLFREDVHSGTKEYVLQLTQPFEIDSCYQII